MTRSTDLPTETPAQAQARAEMYRLEDECPLTSTKSNVHTEGDRVYVEFDTGADSWNHGGCLSRDGAEELLGKLDLALRPPGKPGVVPTEEGKYWWTWECAEEEDDLPIECELVVMEGTLEPLWYVLGWPRRQSARAMEFGPSGTSAPSIFRRRAGTEPFSQNG